MAKAKKAAAKQPAVKQPSPKERDRAARIERRGPVPATFSSPSPTFTPTTIDDLSSEEVSAHAEELSRAAAATVGSTVVPAKGKREAVIVASTATDFTPEAIGTRIREKLDWADYDAVNETRRTGQFHLPYNTTWYPEHRRAFQSISEDTGVPLASAVNMGAVVSPQNDPKRTELPAVVRMAEMISGGGTVDVSPAVSSQIHAVQTHPKAKKQYQENPVIVPAGTHRLSSLNPEQIAVLGSVSGTLFNRSAQNPGEGISEDRANTIGLEFANKARAFPELEQFRPLGAVRQRQNVTDAMRMGRQTDTWDDIKMSGDNATRLDLPSKTTSYNQGIISADENSEASDVYNELMRLYGHEFDTDNLQYMIPFGTTRSAPMDFWQKELALDPVYTTSSGNPVQGVGKPGATIWDAKTKKPKVNTAADLSPEDLTHALLNAGQSIATSDRAITHQAGQAQAWGGVRDPSESLTGQRAAPDVAKGLGLELFQKHMDNAVRSRQQFREAVSRGDHFQDSSDLARNESPRKVDPNQLKLL